MRFFFFTLLILSSCSQMTKILEGEDYKTIYYQKGETHLVFSNNINGEPHPCGCRQFPLGGMAQVWGIMKSWEQNGAQIYVDTGDTFFSGPIIPTNVEQSQRFIAEGLAYYLHQLNLQYMVPGEQDFALGPEFLNQLQEKYDFKFILTNALPENPLKHLKFARIKISNGRTIYFLGVLDPELAPLSLRPYLGSSNLSIKKQLELIKDEHGIKKSDLVILLSHSGIDKDKLLADQFPRINWIIGAHTQSFLRIPYEQNGVMIAQALSRNHYLGKIKLETAGPSEEQYTLQSVSDEWQHKILPNPLIGHIDQFKERLQEIQKSEEQSYARPTEKKRGPTANSCVACHSEQHQFWQGTAHSLAFLTLVQKKAEFNSKCIDCHSLFYQKEEGFKGKSDIVSSSHPQFSSDNYWKYVLQFTQNTKSIRQMSASERKSISAKWNSWDEKKSISHNNANVQCLHCHQQPQDHPFSNAPKVGKVKIDTCLKCHTQDQSQHWYERDGRVKSFVSNKLWKEIACPKMK